MAGLSEDALPGGLQDHKARQGSRHEARVQHLQGDGRAQCADVLECNGEVGKKLLGRFVFQESV